MDTESIDWAGRARALTLQVRNFINGCWAPEHAGELLEKYAPRDGQLLVRFGAGEVRDADDAVGHAKMAFEDKRWSSLSTERRKEVLHKLAVLVETHSEELALLECLDAGKPISSALAFDVPATASVFKYCADAAEHLYSKVYGADQGNLSYDLRRPIGVVAGIVGWNFPLLLAATKIGPALATGNSLVLKPSELTSLSTSRIAALAIEAGVPEGVFNVIHGNSRVGAALAQHADVDLLTFTGSSQTGKQLLIAAGQSNMKRLILECGGKAPNIVFEDAPDLDAVADAVVARAFWNQGQVCTASSRLLVQESIKGKLLPRILERVAALGTGDPLLPDTQLGALVSREHKEKVLRYIAGGENQGARIAYRSTSALPNEGGFYVTPLVFDNVKPTQQIAQEEIFGPVLSVISFRDEGEAIRIANSTIYGLSAILWTQNIGRAHRLTQGIRAGWIVVNASASPRGGPSENALSIGGHKQSGLGVEGGIDGLEAYTSKSAVQVFV